MEREHDQKQPEHAHTNCIYVIADLFNIVHTYVLRTGEPSHGFIILSLTVGSEWEGKQTQQHRREEQHYETTDTAGLDWLGRNVIDVWDEGQGGDDAVDPSKDSVGCVYTDTQTVEQQSSPIKYVVIDHSMNKSQRKEPATEPDDQKVTYATVDKSKKKPKELNGSKTEPGEDVTMGEIY